MFRASFRTASFHAVLAALAAFAPAAGAVIIDDSFRNAGVIVFTSSSEITTVAHLPRSDNGSTVVLAYKGLSCPAGRQCVSIAQTSDAGDNEGRFAPSGSTYAFDSITAAALDSQDRIVIVGGFHVADDDYDFQVLRLLPNGMPDTSFGSSGLAFVGFDQGGGDRDVPHAVTIDRNDRVVVVGEVEFNNPQDFDFGVTRLTAVGDLDATFDNDGRKTIAFDLGQGNPTDIATSVGIDGDFRIVVGGTANDFDLGLTRMGIARLNVNGALDAGWCATSCNFNPYPGINNGRRVIFFGDGADVRTHTLAHLSVNAQGAVVTTGTMRFNGAFSGFVQSFDPDGTWANEIEIDGGAAPGTSSTDPGGVHFVDPSDGASGVVVTGALGPSGMRLFFAQGLTSSLALDPNFGNTGPANSAIIFSATGGFWDPGATQPSLSSIDGRGRVLLAGSLNAPQTASPLGAMAGRLTSLTTIFFDGFEN